MVFSSILFLFVFLPLVLAVHFIAPRAARNSILLGASLVFYWCGAGAQTWILIGSTALDYICGAIQSRSDSLRTKRICVTVSVVCNLALLAYFKYCNFFVSSANDIMQAMGLRPFAPIDVVLPIGISFYTFQTISYQIDLFRGHIKHQRSVIDFSLFVALFPQLVAGPIVRYRDIRKELANRAITLELFSSGVVRFVVGLAKKVLIADPIGTFVDYGFSRGAGALPFELAWLSCVAFAFQVYFDFSAYSDMAIGLGKMLGFRFPENFDYPFVSKTLGEFWRRWHMTLMRWFRDYLFAPLRKLPGGRQAQDRNVMIVFVLSGLWHGASWPFVLWGAYHGLFLILERRALGRLAAKLPVLLQPLYPFTVFAVSAAFFRAESVGQSILFLTAMAGLNGKAELDGLFYFHFEAELIATLIAAAILSTPVIERAWNAVSGRIVRAPGELAGRISGFGAAVARTAAVTALFLASAATAIGQQKSPFIYFRF